MQSRGTVQKNRMLFHHFIENIPNFFFFLFHHLLCTFDGGDVTALFKLIEDERFEELERHLLRQAALVQLKVGTYYDHRTTGVVDALTEKILTETTLLTLEHIAQRTKRALI